MSSPAAQEPASTIGRGLLDFSLNGLFPDEDASLLLLEPDKLPRAIQVLANAKSKLEVRLCLPPLTLQPLKRWRRATCTRSTKKRPTTSVLGLPMRNPSKMT